jgi:hypothetical protein
MTIYKKSETEKKRSQKEKELHSKCRKLGITFEPPLDNETEEQTGYWILDHCFAKYLWRQGVKQNLHFHLNVAQNCLNCFSISCILIPSYSTKDIQMKT